MILLDIAKAFNRIDHSMLYKTLKDIGMSIRVVNWFRSYLQRTRVIGYGDRVSNKFNIPA